MNKNESAEKDYMSGMKYKDIADKHGVSINTVKSWKKRYNWNRKKGCTQNEKGCTQNNTGAGCEKEAVAEEVKEVMSNTDLTDKQQLFCIYYIRCFNATKAYQKAYGVDYATAASIGYRLLENDGVKEEINRLKQERLNREFLSESDIFQKYMDIAFVDITDYVEFGNRTFNDPETDEEVQYSYVNLKDSNTVDGTLISEVSKGKDGAKIKLADRMKALDWLANHMDMATEKQKAEIAVLKAKVQMPDDDVSADDGFTEALNGYAAEDWSDEED